MISPAASSSRNVSQLAQSGTRLELARSTRGAASCVSNTATGLPDCTSSVSGSPRRSSSRTEGVVARPVAAPLADPAVDDELGRVLGDVGMKVVLEHAQRRLLLPALASQLGKAHAATASGAPRLRDSAAA